MPRLWLCLLLLAAFTQSKSIRARYPSQNQYSHPSLYTYQPEVPYYWITEMDQRKFLPQRRLNLWGSKTSKVIQGSAFVPQDVADYTGKLSQRRRELFKWEPDSEFVNRYLRYN